MKRTKNTLRTVVIILFIITIGGNIYFYTKYKHAQDNNPNIQTERIVDALKKTTTVPDETPSVLTVVDRTKLKDTQLADDTQNGDKILLFQKAGEVYIYRPSTGKLVTILNLSPTSQSTTQPTTTPSTGTSQGSSSAKSNQ